MAARSLLEVLTSVVSVPGANADLYINNGPLVQQPIGDAAFGGSILSQAVSAASATVPADFVVFSSQSSFLRPVKAKQPVTYQVERIANGRAFCIRVVRASQGGPCLYTATVSFNKQKSVESSNTPMYSDAIPDLGTARPQDIAKQDFQQALFKLDEADVELLSKSGAGVEDPFDWRLLPYKSASDRLQTRAYAFVRADPSSIRQAPSHLVAMTLLSDISLLELTLFANWESLNEEVKALAMSITLNSQVSFHAPMARIDDWMVCESGTSWAAGERVTIWQRFWNWTTGQLVMSCTQDAFIKHERPGL
ncbi:thioesterase-like superfamily-domain-containing protein [Pestalotiopsis sp. NC0098]|nr:thioesterase-like superfamily-domain-containing protein [Pestalotiopsis sp. NC0098]